MDYTVLTDQNRRNLVASRILQLETDHYSAAVERAAAVALDQDTTVADQKLARAETLLTQILDSGDPVVEAVKAEAAAAKAVVAAQVAAAVQAAS